MAATHNVGGLCGRDEELARLDTALSTAIGGQAQVVLLAGPTGMGKTSILDHLARSAIARGATVVRASGDELEAQMPLGIADQLLAGSDLGAIGGLVGQADGSSAGEHFFGALIDLTRAAAVVVLVDDADWADHSSLVALTFALRRLASRPVFAAFAFEPEANDGLPAGLRRLASGSTGVTIHLGGLTRPALAAALRSTGLTGLSPDIVERIRAHTAGNPMHALALARELGPSAIDADPSRPLPTPRSFATLVLATVAALPPDAEALVAAASVLGSGCRQAIAGQLAGLSHDATAAAFDAAAQAGILEQEVAHGEVVLRWSNPYALSALYHDMRPARVAALHAAAATLVHNSRDALRHRILGGEAHAESLAAEAEATGELLCREGAWMEGAAWLESAAAVTPIGPDRERRLLSAMMFRAYGGSEYPDELDRVAIETDSSLRLVLAGTKAVVESRLLDAETILRTAWDRTDSESEPAQAARIALRIADALHGQARAGEAVEWSGRAVDLAGPSGRLLGEDPLSSHLWGLCVSSDWDAARAVVAERIPPGPAEASTPGLLGRACLRMMSDETLGALEDIRACVDLFGRVGPPHKVVESYCPLIEVRYRRGDWNACLADAETAMARAAEIDYPQLAAFVHGLTLGALAARGEFDAAEQLLTRGNEFLAVRGSYEALGALRLGEARLAAALGDHQRAVDALSLISSVATVLPAADEQGSLSWRLPYTAALVALGRLAEAEESADRVQAGFDRTGFRSVWAMAERLRGLIADARGDSGVASSHFALAADLFRDVTMPFEAALADLDHGCMLRRVARDQDALRHLDAARSVLQRLQARPYLARCDSEIAECSNAGGPSADGRFEGAGLTPAEESVARLVAAGKTNREAAAELVLSVRTIESHLGNVYAKLGISSRSQLAAYVAR